MSWIDVGALDDIPLRGARTIRTRAGCMALFRVSASEVLAVSDTCPHRGGPLSEGIVHGLKVTCPLHNWVFDLRTGLAEGADEGEVATYEVRIEDGRLLIDTALLSRKAA